MSSSTKEHLASMSDTGKDGSFQRKSSVFRNWIAKGSEQYPPEANRYHLYISLACPWAHRTYIMRGLKGLEHVIGLSIVSYHMGKFGWTFTTPEEIPGTIPDTVKHSKLLRDLYTFNTPDYDGRVTVPVLWDKKTDTIVNNESSEIIRMLNSEFNEWAKHPELDFYPQELRQSIDEINEFILPNINNGVYRAGFATTQIAYEEGCKNLFSALDKSEIRLSTSRYLCGDKFTEADIRLFTTLVRFDAVYFGHFKCNVRQLREYHHLHNYLREIYQMPIIHDTVDFTHIKCHYYMSHPTINPHGIVPVGPNLDTFNEPHNRATIGGHK